MGLGLTAMLAWDYMQCDKHCGESVKEETGHLKTWFRIMSRIKITQIQQLS